MKIPVDVIRNLPHFSRPNLQSQGPYSARKARYAKNIMRQWASNSADVTMFGWGTGSVNLSSWQCKDFLNDGDEILIPALTPSLDGAGCHPPQAAM